MTGLRRFALALPALLCSLALLAGGATARPAAAPNDLVEVVVTLPQAPLAAAIVRDRGLATATTARHRLNLRAPASVSYLRTLASAQRALLTRTRETILAARTQW